MSLCRHCNRLKANRPLGLCWTCYYTPGVRAMYPSTSKFAGRGEPDEPVEECQPTTALPGTAEKKAVMAARFAAGQPIFHPADPVIVHEPYLRSGCGVRTSGLFEDPEGLLSQHVTGIMERAFYFPKERQGS